MLRHSDDCGLVHHLQKGEGEEFQPTDELALNRRLILKHFGLAGALLGLWSAYAISGLSCPVLAITGMICPTCGTTRALLALLQGNISGYLSFQPMALPMIAAVLLCIHLPHMRNGYRQAATGFAISILLLNVGRYVLVLQHLT